MKQGDFSVREVQADIIRERYNKAKADGAIDDMESCFREMTFLAATFAKQSTCDKMRSRGAESQALKIKSQNRQQTTAIKRLSRIGKMYERTLKILCDGLNPAQSGILALRALQKGTLIRKGKSIDDV